MAVTLNLYYYFNTSKGVGQVSKRLIQEKISKVLESLSNIRIVPVCLVSYVIKTLIITPSYAESVIVVALSALYGFYHLIESRRVPKPTEIMYEEMKAVKAQLASIKVNMGMKLKDNNAETTKKRRF
jgi:hypothetical protein